MGIECAHFQTNPFSDILQPHMRFGVPVFSWTKPCLNDAKNLRVDPNPNHPTSGQFTFLMLGCVLGILMYFGGQFTQQIP